MHEERPKRFVYTLPEKGAPQCIPDFEYVLKERDTSDILFCISPKRPCSPAGRPCSRRLSPPLPPLPRLSLLLSGRTQETQTECHLYPPDSPEAHLHKFPGCCDSRLMLPPTGARRLCAYLHIQINSLPHQTSHKQALKKENHVWVLDLSLLGVQACSYTHSSPPHPHQLLSSHL